MPEESKKNQRRNDSKDQRRPRHGRRQEAQAEKRAENKVEEPKEAPKVVVPQKPPVYESPGPEFYQNLKRETDEILKITEEECTKYKKKEIQSNWSKYEMPIESYDDIKEQENLGADYEKLIQAPLTSGGHFQFKHEKSWYLNTGPSPYDKYFNINMDNLTVALSTMPFYERNSLDQTIFTETDMLNMNNRATRYKQKYFNDKSYTTPEIEAQEKILNSLKENVSKVSDIEAQEKILNDLKDDFDKNQDIINNDEPVNTEIEYITIESRDITNKSADENKSDLIHSSFLDHQDVPKTGTIRSPINIDDIIEDDIIKIDGKKIETENIIDSVTIEPMIHGKILKSSESTKVVMESSTQEAVLVSTKKVGIVPEVKANTQVVENSVNETKQNPVIESPEDLEKWLDDFLDG